MVRPDGKMFGSRSGRTDRATDKSISILSYDHLLLKFWKFCLNLNRTRLHKIRRPPRAEQLHKSFYNRKLSNNFFALNKKLTIHWFIFSFFFQLQFMLKSQQKVDIKLSKISKTMPSKTYQVTKGRFTPFHWNCLPIFLIWPPLFKGWITLSTG